ncbi:MAG: hypothetical protein WBP45_12145 [Daejeonella sp.]
MAYLLADAAAVRPIYRRSVGSVRWANLAYGEERNKQSKKIRGEATQLPSKYQL